MTNLGSGGEAKASPADREAAETDLGQSSETGGTPERAEPTSTHTKLGAIPSSYGASGGTVGDDEAGDGEQRTP